jgi:hypothetical protein
MWFQSVGTFARDFRAFKDENSCLIKPENVTIITAVAGLRMEGRQ